MVLQRLLDVTDIKAHSGDFSSHCGLNTLAARNDRVRGIDTGPHLIKVNIHGIHGSSEVLHITLTCKDDAAHMIDFTFVVAEEVLQLTHIILQLIQVLSHGVKTSSSTCCIKRFHHTLPTVDMRKLLVKVTLHIRKLCCDLCLEILQPCRDLLKYLRITASGLTGGDEASIITASITFNLPLDACNLSLNVFELPFE